MYGKQKKSKRGKAIEKATHECRSPGTCSNHISGSENEVSIGGGVHSSQAGDENYWKDRVRSEPGDPSIHPSEAKKRNTMNNEIQIQQEGVTTYIKDGQLVAIHYKDMKSRHDVFYKAVEMGQEEVADLFRGSVKPLNE